MTGPQEHLAPVEPTLSNIRSDMTEPLVSTADDQTWVDVIKQMDSMYAELVDQQVELEKKNTELEDTQQFIQRVISSISDILIVCDINNSILQGNTALESITGIELTELVGKPLETLFIDEQQSRVSSFPQLLRTGTQIDTELDLISTIEHSVPMYVIGNPLYDKKNRLTGIVITGRPLGELRKAYKELHQSHETLKQTQHQLVQSEKLASLGRLVAGVAHELNNPISFLYANMHALQSYESKLKTYFAAIHNNVDEKQRETLRSELKIDALLEDIEPLIEGSLEGAERVSDIVKNLRHFVTPQKQQQGCFDLVAVIRRAVTWVQSASSLEVELQTDLPEQFKLVNKEGNIHQILVNLIQNAIDSMAHTPSPVLKIQIQHTAEEVQVLVHDNGPGIAEENLVRIFDPFFTTKAIGSGTGLGLYICYNLAVEQCNGELTACNHEDGGALFRLSLPWIRADE